MSRWKKSTVSKPAPQFDLAAEEKRASYNLKVSPIGVKIGAARASLVHTQLEAMRLTVRGVQATPTVVHTRGKKERRPRCFPELNLTVDMMSPVRHNNSPVSMNASPKDRFNKRESNNGSSLIDCQHAEPVQKETRETEQRPVESVSGLSKPQTGQLPQIPAQMVREMPQSPVTTDPILCSPIHADPGQQMPSSTNPFQNANSKPKVIGASPPLADTTPADKVRQNLSYQERSNPQIQRKASGNSNNDIDHLLTGERPTERVAMADEEEAVEQPPEQVDREESPVSEPKKTRIVLAQEAHVEGKRQNSPRSSSSLAEKALHDRLKSFDCDFMNTSEMFGQRFESEKSSSCQREGEQSPICQQYQMSNDQPKYYTLHNRPFVIVDGGFSSTIKIGSAHGRSGSSELHNSSFSSVSPRHRKFSNLKPTRVDIQRIKQSNQATDANINLNLKAKQVVQPQPKLSIVQPLDARSPIKAEAKAFLPQLQQRALRAKQRGNGGAQQNESKSPDDTRRQNRSQCSDWSGQVRDLLGAGGLVEHKNPVNLQPNRITPKQVYLAQMLNQDASSNWKLDAETEREAQYNKQLQEMEEVISRRQVHLDHMLIPNLTSRAGSSHNSKGSRDMVATLACAQKAEIVQIDQVQEYEDAINDVVNCIKRIESKQTEQRLSDRNQIGAKNVEQPQQFSQNSFGASFGKRSGPPNRVFGGPAGSIGSINTLQLDGEEGVLQSPGMLNVRSDEREFSNTVSAHQLKQQLSQIRNNSTINESNQQFSNIRPQQHQADKSSCNKTYQGFPTQFKPKETDYSTSRNYFKAETSSTVMTPNLRNSMNSAVKKQGNQLSLALSFSNNRQSQIYIQNQQEGMKVVRSMIQAPKPKRRPPQLPRKTSMFKGESADKRLTITQILGIGGDKHNLKKIKKPMTMLEHSMKLSKQMESANTKQLANIVENSTQVNSPRAPDLDDSSSPLVRTANYGDDSVQTQYPGDGLSHLSSKEQSVTRTKKDGNCVNIVLLEQMKQAYDVKENSRRAFQFFKTIETSKREQNNQDLLNSQIEFKKQKAGRSKRKLLLKLGGENKQAEGMELQGSVDSMPDSLGSIGSFDSPSDDDNDYVHIRSVGKKKTSLPLDSESADAFHLNTADYIQTLKNSQGAVSPLRPIGEQPSHTRISRVQARVRIPEETLDEVLTGGEVSQKSSFNRMRATLQEKTIGKQLTKQPEMNPSAVVYRLNPQAQTKTQFHPQSTSQPVAQPPSISKRSIAVAHKTNQSSPMKHSRAFLNNQPSIKGSMQSTKFMIRQSPSHINDGKMSSVRSSITVKESNFDLLTQTQNLQQQKTSFRIQARTKRSIKRMQEGFFNAQNEEQKEVQAHVAVPPSFLKNFPSTLSISAAELTQAPYVHRNSSLPENMTLNKQVKKYQDSAIQLKANDSHSSKGGRQEKELLRIQEIQQLTQRRVAKGNSQMVPSIERVRSIGQNSSARRRDVAIKDEIAHQFDKANRGPVDTKRSKLEKIKMASREYMTQRVAGQSDKSKLYSTMAILGLPELKRGGKKKMQPPGQSSPQGVDVRYVKPLSNMPFGSQQNSGVVCIGQHISANTYRLEANATSPRNARKLRELVVRGEQGPSSVNVCLPLQIREQIPSFLGTGANPSHDDGTGTTGNATGHQSKEQITEPIN